MACVLQNWAHLHNGLAATSKEQPLGAFSPAGFGCKTTLTEELSAADLNGTNSPARTWRIWFQPPKKRGFRAKRGFMVHVSSELIQ